MSFPLCGNTKIKLATENAIKENRLPHAILIEGDKGTGRHTLAFYLASATVCGGENPPCGACRECAMGQNHPDITVVKPEEGKKNIAVSQIRNLKADAYIKPHQAKRRVFIIDFADTLNEQSQNAILKVLEEPPQTASFILIAESKASLIETVLSRCVILSLTAPQTDVAAEYIKGCTDYSAHDILSALKTAENNIGTALGILSGASASKTKSAAEEFLKSFLKSDSFGMLTSVAEIEKSRIDADMFLKDLKILSAKELRENKESYKAAYLLRLYELVRELQESLVTNINLTLLFCTLTSRAEAIIK